MSNPCASCGAPKESNDDRQLFCNRCHYEIFFSNTRQPPPSQGNLAPTSGQDPLFDPSAIPSPLPGFPPSAFYSCTSMTPSDLQASGETTGTTAHPSYPAAPVSSYPPAYFTQGSVVSPPYGSSLMNIASSYYASYNFGSPPQQAGMPSADPAPSHHQSTQFVEGSSNRPIVKTLIASPEKREESIQRRRSGGSYHSPPDLQCHICGQDFTKRHNLESHVRSHYGERPYACTHCGLLFGRRTDCQRHEQKYCKRRPSAE